MSRFAFLDSPRPLAFAHRGGPSGRTENTLDAFDAVQQLGYQYVETDVRTTRDGVPLIFHDADLLRVTGVSGRIGAMNAADVQQIAAAAGTSIPTLVEVLERYPAMRFNLDMKDEASVRAVTTVVSAEDIRDRVCVTSFSERRVRMARKLLGPDVCTGVGTGAVALLGLQSLLRRRLTTTAGALQVPMAWHGRRVLTSDVIERAHDAGVQVHVWTLNTAPDIIAALDLGVDGIMTDQPELLKQTLESRGGWH